MQRATVEMQVKRGLVSVDFGCVDFVIAEDEYFTSSVNQ
jgi:hypothetical protein